MQMSNASLLVHFQPITPPHETLDIDEILAFIELESAGMWQFIMLSYLNVSECDGHSYPTLNKTRSARGVKPLLWAMSPIPLERAQGKCIY